MRKRGPGHADELIESIDRLSLLARRGNLPGPKLCRLSERVPTKFARYETFVPWPKPWRSGGAWLLHPGISDVNLFSYCKGIIYLDAQISDRAFDLCVPEQQLDRPEISSAPIDKGMR